MPVYNKLIRDKIPDIIKKENKKFNIRILDDEEFKFEIIKKIGEEYQELLNSKNNDEEIEELADLFELIITLSGVFDLSLDELNAYRMTKKEKRGGFEEKIFLIDVED